MSFTNVMIDLETLGRRPGCVVLSLGAVVMLPHQPQDCVHTGATFYANLDSQLQVDAGLHVDPDTVAWWGKQDDAAKSALTVNVRRPREALMEFTGWLYNLSGGDKNVRLWANGADFDLPILAELFRALMLNQPWRFYNDRCYRTLKNLFKSIPAGAFLGTKHDALEDALFQANHACRIMNEFDCWEQEDAKTA